MAEGPSPSPARIRAMARQAHRGRPGGAAQGGGRGRVHVGLQGRGARGQLPPRRVAHGRGERPPAAGCSSGCEFAAPEAHNPASAGQAHAFRTA
eukprot:4303599-Lingulodinium_polyedra.AAC.1